MKKCLWRRSADSALPAAHGGDGDGVLKLSWQPSLGDREARAVTEKMRRRRSKGGGNREELKGAGEREELLV